MSAFRLRLRIDPWAIHGEADIRLRLRLLLRLGNILISISKLA